MFGDVKSKEKCRKPVQIGKGAASQGCGKLSLRTQNATTGAEARTDFGALRGAEAPLFHVTRPESQQQVPHRAIGTARNDKVSLWWLYAALKRRSST